MVEVRKQPLRRSEEHERIEDAVCRIEERNLEA